MKGYFFIAASFAVLAANSATAKTWFVNLAATGTASGASWANAYTTLQPAISAASAGDSIFVAKGIYYPTVAADGVSTDNRDKAFMLKNGTFLFGGFAGTEANYAARKNDSTSLHVTNLTTLSGNLGNVADSTDNAYHVVIASGLAPFLFDGFTVAYGNANGTTPLMVGTRSIGRHYGGGVYNDSTFGRYSNVIIANNTAVSFDATEGGGGGMYNYHGNLQIQQAVFLKNHANNANGGGLKNNGGTAQVSFSHFLQNTSVTDDEGGGAANNIEHGNAAFNSVVFEANWTSGSGGGVYNDSSSSSFNLCTFIYNAADGSGGGVDFDNGSSGSLINVLFYRNSSTDDGGGLYSWKSNSILDYVQFSYNVAGNNGGGMYNYNTCNPQITNTQFSNNQAGNDYGGFGLERNSTAILTNVLFSRNQAARNGGGLGSHDNSGTTATLIATNVTVVNNTALTGGGGYDQGSTTQLRNSIIFGNYPDDVDINPALILNVRSVIVNDGTGPLFFKDGSVSTTGVSVSASIFVDTTTSNYRLITGSPAIDAGDSTFYSATSTPNLSAIKTDLRGADRIMGNNVDLGAYEYCTNTVMPTATVSVTPSGIVWYLDSAVFTLSIINGGTNPTIQWWKNNSPIAGANGLTYTAKAGVAFLDKDTIWAKIQSSAPCVLPDTAKSNKIGMTVLHEGVAGISPADLELGIVPNPNKGSFSLNGNFKSNKTYNLVITDIVGRRIYQEDFQSGSNQKQILLPATVLPGMYLLSIKQQELGQQTIRLVVE
ncbi:MAG: choice-of-anchor Q domain-containing protein [Chitinophagaceae bacterium]